MYFADHAVSFFRNFLKRDALCSAPCYTYILSSLARNIKWSSNIPQLDSSMTDAVIAIAVNSTLSTIVVIETGMNALKSRYHYFRKLFLHVLAVIY